MSTFEIIIDIHKNGASRAVSATIKDIDTLDPEGLARIMTDLARTLHHDLVGQGWIYPRSYKKGDIIPAPANWFEKQQVLDVGEM